MKIKFISFVAVVAMLMSFVSINVLASSGATLTVTGDTVKAGESATIVFSLSNSEPCNAFVFKATFAETFKVSAVDTSNCSFMTNFSDGSINKYTLNQNSYKFDVSDSTGSEDKTGDGELIIMTVDVPEGTAAGTYPITVSNVEYYTSEFEDLEYNVVTANIIVESSEPPVDPEPEEPETGDVIEVDGKTAVIDDAGKTRFVVEDTKASVGKTTAASILKVTYAGTTKQANLWNLLKVEEGATGEIAIGNLTVKVILGTDVIDANSVGSLSIAVQ